MNQDWRKSKAHLPPEARKGRPPGPGRPTGYQPEYADRVYRLSLYGLTDEELGECFNVDPATLHRWMKAYPEFRVARDKGRIEADANLTDRLYERLGGYEYTETKVTKNDKGEIINTVETTKQLPADPQGIFRWLELRYPKKWRTKTEIEISSPEMRRLLDKMDQWPDDAIARLGAGEAPELVVKSMKAEVVRGLLTGSIEDAEIVEDPLSAEQDD